MHNENWDYIINGKKHSLPRIIFLAVIAAFMAVLTVDQFKPAENKSFMLACIFAILTVIPLCLLLYVLNRVLFFKILIGKEGFYFQTNPFNGKHYLYSEISSCHIKVETAARQSDNTSRHYLVFVMQNRTAKQVLFEPHLHEKEIEILKDRINTK